MKKLIAIITILATAAVFAQTVTVVSNLADIKPKTKEVLIFDIDITTLQGVEVEDELGSKYIRTDFTTRRVQKVLYYQKASRAWECWEARTPNGRSLNGSGNPKQAVMVCNVKDGSSEGYIALSLAVSAADVFTPPVNCYLSGQTDNRYDEELGRWVLVSGHGYLTGQSYSSSWMAFGYMEKASPCVQTAFAPAWGTFTVRHAVMTDAEIVDLIK